MPFRPHLFVILSLVSQLEAQVVINEIFYNSPADLDRLEFIELHNAGTDSVDLSGWEFSKGIDYTFPKGSSITAGAYQILCADEALFKQLYEMDSNGAFKKSLNNGGETVTLTDADGKKIDSVKYDDKAPWPKSPDGYSASLERICPAAAGNDVANWVPSVLSDDYDSKPSGTPGKQNSVYAKTLAPVIEDVTVSSEVVQPNQSLTVQAKVAATAKMTLLYRVVAPGAAGEEIAAPMTLGDDGRYSATIPGQKPNCIIRFRVQATGNNGARRHFPHPNEIRPALSVYVDGNFQPGKIPVAHFFNIGAQEHKSGAAYRTSHARSRGGRGFDRGGGGRRETAEDRLRREMRDRLSDDSLEKAWAKLTLSGNPESAKIGKLAKPFKAAQTSLAKLRESAESAQDIEAFSEGLDGHITAFRKALIEETTTLIGAEAQKVLDAIGIGEVNERGRGGRGFGNPAEMLPRIFNVEESWFRAAMIEGMSGAQLDKLAEAHRAALKDRSGLVQGDDVDFREVFENARDLQEDLRDAIEKVLNEDQMVAAFGGDRQDRGGFGGRDRGRRDRRGGPPRGPGGRASDEGVALPPQGRSALIYTDPETMQPQLFDFVNITQRKSGYKVRLHKDKPLNGLTTLNVLYESNEGTTINEALAYDLYRLAGNKTAEAGFMRVLIDGEVAGYHLWFEQPNGAFFRKNEINDKGNLYKLIWMGSHRPSKYTPEDKLPERMDIVGKYEKKTHPHNGYDDIVSLIEGLEGAQGDDAEMWQLIQDNFEVDQVINYFAVNALLSHWDGFFNNYFVYHDVKGSGKWSMYPWDQDSTWSLRMGNVDELSKMPINYGAEGARHPDAQPRREDARDQGRDRRGRGGFRGFGGGRGGPGWWRDGGDISRPLLANPEFFKRFKVRLKTLAETVFTDEAFGPKIDALMTTLEPEVRLRAETFERDPDESANSLKDIVTSMREHLERRTEFILEELVKE